MKSFGARLSHIMKIHNIPQKELAKKSDLDQAWISKIKSDIRAPSHHSLVKILKVLPKSVDICWLLFGGDNKDSLKQLRNENKELQIRINGLERNNAILAENVLPDGHWAAPMELTSNMCKAFDEAGFSGYTGTWSIIVDSAYYAMRDAYLAETKK